MAYATHCTVPRCRTRIAPHDASTLSAAVLPYFRENPMHKFLLLLGSLLIGLAAQAAPGDVFLVQIPSITGGVNLAKYRGWFLVNSFSTGVTTATSYNPGSGGGASKPMCQPLVLIKPLDTTSPELALAAASGKHLATVTLAALSGGN